MRHFNKSTDLEAALKEAGVSRRDFLKYCGAVAATLGLAETMAPQIAEALTAAAKLKPVIWLEAGSCSGCTESMAQVGSPDIATVVLDILSLNYSETLMAGAGFSAEQSRKDTIAAGGYILVYEGAVMTGWDGNALRIGGIKGTDQLLESVAKADAVIAVGSCASDGGWVAAAPNPAKATGVTAFFAKNGVKTPVINLPTCPVNPEWVVAMVVDVLMIGALPKMDSEGRPTAIFGSTIHDNCPRRGHFENGEFVEQFGDPHEAEGWCLYKLGCKGPQTKTNCPLIRWNEKVSWCVESGAPCIGCGNAIPTAGGTGNWVDADAPFFSRLANVTLPGIGGVAPSTVGAVIGGVAAVGLVAHGIASAAKGRVKGVPTETEKVFDAKKKGGDK
jgi:hydrogenase small subunit